MGICVKNFDDALKETLDSIVKQNFPHEEMEVIVVESRSNSKVMNPLVAGVSQANIKMNVYSDKGKGLAVARQVVVDNACGEYIVWVDGDVMLSEDFVSRQVDFMNRNPRVGIAIGKYECVELEGKFVANALCLWMSLQRIVYFGATICRTRVIRTVQGFDPRIRGASEDVDLVRKIVLADWKLAHNSGAKFFHKQRETLGDLLKRGIWYGQGSHFASHKCEGALDFAYMLPLIYFIIGIKLSFKAYRRHRRKKAFLIPLLCTLFSVGWFLGFFLGHMHGYGHEILTPEINKTKTRSAKRKMQAMLNN